MLPRSNDQPALWQSILLQQQQRLAWLPADLETRLR